MIEQELEKVRKYSQSGKIFIDIPYAEMKKAVEEAGKKQGICKILPHGRFFFDFIREGFGVRRVEECDGQKITYGGLVCEALGGESTGTAASECRNCVIHACKHKHTRKELCDRPDCSHYGKDHTICLDCGVMVDLWKEHQRMTKRAQRTMKFLEQTKK